MGHWRLDEYEGAGMTVVTLKITLHKLPFFDTSIVTSVVTFWGSLSLIN